MCLREARRGRAWRSRGTGAGIHFPLPHPFYCALSRQSVFSSAYCHGGSMQPFGAQPSQNFAPAQHADVPPRPDFSHMEATTVMPDMERSFTTVMTCRTGHAGGIGRRRGRMMTMGSFAVSQAQVRLEWVLPAHGQTLAPIVAVSAQAGWRRRNCTSLALSIPRWQCSCPGRKGAHPGTGPAFKSPLNIYISRLA